MTRARTVVQAVLLSITFLLSSAVAAPVDRAYTGVAGTLGPDEDGPFVRVVVGDASEATMRVRWECGQPQLCVVEGAQYEYGPYVILVPPDGAETPLPLFVLLPHGTCPDLGNTARVGGWSRGGQIDIYQCFTLAPRPRVTTRPNLPPVQVALPPDIRTLARAAQAEAQRRNRLRSTP